VNGRETGGNRLETGGTGLAAGSRRGLCAPAMQPETGGRLEMGGTGCGRERAPVGCQHRDVGWKVGAPGAHLATLRLEAGGNGRHVSALASWPETGREWLRWQCAGHRCAVRQCGWAGHQEWVA
jgi:hypothetical protein